MAAAAVGRRLLLQSETPRRQQQQAAPSPWSAGYLNTWLSQRTPVFGLRLWVLMGIAVGAAIVLVLLLLFLCLSRRRRGRRAANLYHPADAKPLKQQQHLQHQHAPTPAKDIQEIVRRQQHQQPAPTPLPQPAAAQMAKAEPPPPQTQTLQQQRAQLPAMPAGSKRSTAASGLSATTSGGSERDLATPRSAGCGAMGPEVSHLGWGHWFTLRELEEATDGLAEENVIGEGGYGIVYRGTLQDSTIIAVKNLLNNRGQAEKEFKVEVETIGRVRHKNLVRLLGYCVEGAYRMLVYEYVDNGNLDQWLHGEIGEESPLTWDMRMNIIIGTAKGLAYLHEGLEPKVVHRDVKSSNILIDKQWNAKVSDFGLAKLLCSEESYVTTRVMGTFGYVAPEYASTGMLTERSDVYSFGVLLMEIITGRSPVDYTRSAGEVNLIEWLKNMVAERKAEEVVDPKLPERPSPKALKRALLVALRCVDPDGHKRPKMGHVIHMLEMEDLNPRDDRKPRRDAATDRSSSMEDGSLSKRENQRYR
ncbi:probable serine/threonine-protein kinase At1g01540 [Triticum dicoccoides]|uniref:probable serine/threonine-protein kinase At1g01540 n=1 Tax=Triticum dicoccoides TaxID=85692 RepID=UPI00188E7AED|nr:probable serine/threonine-protein kinase At1g01540 [Triticum dicoccoides]